MLLIFCAGLLDTAFDIWDTRENFHQEGLNVSGEDFCHMWSASLQTQLANLLVIRYIQIPGVSGKGEALV